ncbi:hypothetical protein BDN70DRAFT_157757 [Pholiota conissans]|uniref:Uncharacterized protein n=1 Tax=Pholiota conissans TaxID=109636 RepID=A0A9P5YWU3_9AGAR|nr:hypothetical protein BDN70DRAFT_157757 [Pholiota conissans]
MITSLKLTHTFYFYVLITALHACIFATSSIPCCAVISGGCDEKGSHITFQAHGIIVLISENPFMNDLPWTSSELKAINVTATIDAKIRLFQKYTQ